MPCTKPLQGWILPGVSLKPVFSLTRPGGPGWEPVKVACRGCVGCQDSYAMEWMVRSTHESKMHRENCFLTLTFDKDHLPYRGQLVKSYYQNFLKRTRNKFSDPQFFDKYGWKPSEMTFRYFGCGEYGDERERPHFHLNAFGIDFHDRKTWTKSGSGVQTYTSELLSSLWPYGIATVQDYDARSARYCANYIVKRFRGPNAAEHYRRFDSMGEFQLTPEFPMRSTNPGIGIPFLEKYWRDLYLADFAIVDGAKYPVPRAYDFYIQERFPTFWADIVSKRQVAADAQAADRTPERLAVIEQCKLARRRVRDDARSL